MANLLVLIDLYPASIKIPAKVDLEHDHVPTDRIAVSIRPRTAPADVDVAKAVYGHIVRIVQLLIRRAIELGRPDQLAVRRRMLPDHDVGIGRRLPARDRHIGVSARVHCKRYRLVPKLGAVIGLAPDQPLIGRLSGIEFGHVDIHVVA